jgi:hypothetical protein
MRRITAPDQLATFRADYAKSCAGDSPMQCHRAKVGEAVAYTWTDDKGRPRALAWLGRAQNPYSGNGAAVGGPYWFKDSERRRAWVAQCFARAASAAERTGKARAEKAAARAKPHALQVGDVLRSVWGYDQTNIDYYEVTALVGSQMVEYRRIGCQSVMTGDMQGDSVPAPGQYIGEAKRARVSEYGERDSIKVCSFANASKMHPVTLPGGIKVYKPSQWTAYA